MPDYDLRGKTVVIIDIFRASSAICTALHWGVSKIIPLSTLAEAKDYKNKGFIVAAERGGEVVEGFDFGNSPFTFQNEKLKGKTIVLTTSNGTKAILKAFEANQILIGSFLNITKLVSYLNSQESDIVLLCAGWKNRFNLEDTTFAGAVAERLKSSVHIESDSTLAAMDIYLQAAGDIRSYLSKASHAKRLSHLDIERDIEYCLKLDLAPSLPVFRNGVIENLV